MFIRQPRVVQAHLLRRVPQGHGLVVQSRAGIWLIEEDETDSP